MPRLLLVDDNPSIHKIAESLLAHSQIELVCAESGPKALDLVASASAPFDVALIDISMADMDGWELLGKLRTSPGTARMPIAMMAGVLDTVDPGRLADAPIQGFLKKPVELRDLQERVQVLLETPVPEPAPLPEAAPEPQPPSPFETLPAQHLSDFQARLDTDDLLELTEEDLYPEETAATAALPAEEPLGESLDLEELDLDSLKDLGVPETEAPEPAAEAAPDFMFDSEVITVEDLPSLEDEATRITQETPLVDLLPTPEETPLELPEEALEEVLASPFPEPVEEFAPEPEEEFAPEPVEAEPEAPVEAEASVEAQPEELPAAAATLLPEIPAPAPPEAAALPLAVAPAEPEPVPQEARPLEGPDAQALVAAILADPALLDTLAKAVAARLSEQTLREVAWEIMPEIAERQKYL